MNYYLKLVLYPVGSAMVSVAAVLSTTDNWRPVVAAALAAFGSNLVAYLKSPPEKETNEKDSPSPAD